MTAIVREFRWGHEPTRDHPVYKPAQLTPAQRDEIGYRRMEGERSIDLAAEYGVARSLVDRCVKKERPRPEDLY